MISKLRNKFVIYMVTSFALCFFVIISIYVTYKHFDYKNNLYQELSWIADNNIKKIPGNEYSNELNLDIQYYGYNPIYIYIVNDNNRIVSKKIIGRNRSTEPPHLLLKKIFRLQDNKWTLKSFVFYNDELKNGNRVFFIIDSKSDTDITRILNLSFIAFFSLFLITNLSIYLSKFAILPAQAALNREKQLSSDISHELKNPIAAIKVNLQALSTDGINSIYLDNAISETKKMNNIVNQLLILSRAERLEDSVNNSNVNLSKLLERLCLIYEVLAFEKQIKLTYYIEQSIFINGYEKDIENAISIILENAIKYNIPNGMIALNLIKSKDLVKIEISDTGIGISDIDLPHIFERFYISSSYRNDSFGLGLSIAQAIILRHSGSIKVKSSLGKGTTFIITLPKS